jgi:transcriptional regulator with XRE-family HTH domain
MSIAANLRREMDEQGVTVAKLAAQVECEPSSVRKYLSGAVRPSERVLERLGRCLGCNANELRYGRPKRRDGKLRTDDVARVTGIDPLSLRIGLQRGIWPFGVAYKRAGSSKFVYEYDPAEVLRWVAARKALTSGGAHEAGEQVQAAEY